MVSQIELPHTQELVQATAETDPGAETDAGAETDPVADPGERDCASHNVAVLEANTDSLTLHEQCIDSDSVSSTGSCGSWMELRFQQQADAWRFVQFMRLSIVFSCMYSIAAATSFFSSLYPVDPGAKDRHSAVDAFLVTSNIISIDISSAFFVITGFFCAYTLANVNSGDIKVLFRIVMLNTVLDLWVATFLSIVFGSIFHMLRHTFAYRDVVLTLIEGLTCMRTWELTQAPQAMHSLNPTSWPAMCLLYAFLLTPWTIMSNNRLYACYPKAGMLLLLVNAVAPILTISLFALLHEDTNIFYINATHFGYRLLEYNVGVCFFACIQKHANITTKFTYADKCLCPAIIAVFLLIWWAQLGTSVVAAYGTCIRMYYFSPCIQVHHGFLMRGCGLGMTLLCSITLEKHESSMFMDTMIDSHSSFLANSVSTVVFIWPACYIIHLLLELNFSVALVHENAALLVLLVPVITFLLSSLWNKTWKIKIVAGMDRTIDRVLCARASGQNESV